jgi:hypothetical protein
MELPDFVAKQNIARFGAQLISETDATRRAELQRLLIQEEDRLGFRYQGRASGPECCQIELDRR